MKRIAKIFVSLSLALTAIPLLRAGDYDPMGSNFYAYPYTDSEAPQLSPAPQGYRPFHIEHYGRHGSRWHIGKSIYSAPVEILQRAADNGKLTERGKLLLAQLSEIERNSRGHDGELTAKGARQHRGIARRMMANFPELFPDSVRIDARSTPVHRCILSMTNELVEMAAANPTFVITTDASASFLPELNPEDSLTRSYSDKAYSHFIEYEKNDPFRYDFLKKIFVDDEAYVADSVDRGTLLWTLFNIASNVQSHDDQPDLFDIFTPQEIEQKWQHTNLDWFLRSGNTACSDNMTPFSQRRLLRSFIAGGDSAIVAPRQNVALRFGHEVVVLPVVVLMELGDYGREINDLNAVASQWRNYEIFPMAANIQLIFYEGTDGRDKRPILVKALLNEREVSLPVGKVEGNYYDWNTLRSYWLNKLDRWEDANLSREQ